MFQLHPRLAADTVGVGDFLLCRLLLCRDANYPWCILVPRLPDIQEIYQLSASQQQQLMVESSHLASCMAEQFNADKMNVASLGNMVPQLHLHHVVRYQTDGAWPKPIWGAADAKEYTAEELTQQLELLAESLAGGEGVAAFTPF